MKKYEKYKSVDLIWLNEVPEHWELLPIISVLSERKEKNYKNNSMRILSVLKDVGVMPYEQKGNIGNKFSEDISKYNLVLKDDIVINSMNIIIGSVGKSKYNGILSQVYYVLKNRNIKKTNIDYLEKVFKHKIFQEHFKIYGRGILEHRLKIPMEKLKRVRIPIPPFEEQKQIANYLDWKINDIDKEIDNHLDKIKKMKEYKDSYVKKLVNYGVGKANKLKKIENNVFEFIPQNWQNRYIFQVSTENKVKNNNMKNRNLLSLSYGKIIEKNIDKTDGLLPESFETYQIIKTGMIVLRLTDLQNDHKSLRVGICKSTGIITSAYVVLKVTEEILPEYMYYLLHSFDISKGLYGMGRGVRQSLNYKDFSTILIPLPSLKEQRLIVDACEKIDLNIKKMIDSISKKIELLKELKNSIISEVVTGKIDVRDVIIPKYKKLNVNEVIKENSFEKGIESDDE